MKKSMIALFLVAFVFQGLLACASREEAKSEAETPNIVDQEDQLPGYEKELKAADSPNPLPLTGTELSSVKGAPLLNSELKPLSKESSRPSKKEVMKKSAVSSQGGFKTTAKSCAMKSEPDLNSETLTTIPKGRKLWAEKSGRFYKVSRSKGIGFLAKSCF